MLCVRCRKGQASVVATAPDGSKAWEIYKCNYCNFCWRNTEPAETITPELMDPHFRMDGVDISTLLNPCAIPPLRRNRNP